jgi:hypothetical protein
MNITKPEQKITVISKLEQAIALFEKLLSKEPKNQDSYYLTTYTVFDEKVRSEVAKAYKEVGWTSASCGVANPDSMNSFTYLSLKHSLPNFDADKRV